MEEVEKEMLRVLREAMKIHFYSMFFRENNLDRLAKICKGYKENEKS